MSGLKVQIDIETREVIVKCDSDKQLLESFFKSQELRNLKVVLATEKKPLRKGINIALVGSLGYIGHASILATNELVSERVILAKNSEIERANGVNCKERAKGSDFENFFSMPMKPYLDGGLDTIILNNRKITTPKENRRTRRKKRKK